ncbi:AaceriAGL051Cp [[Ashbya] aceris (nom. inval.)]|nr:AaceriAGL051Cp [[Ashbya] aceris (nom. inval.)]
MSIEVLLTVGKLDASLALLTTQNHHVIEFPTVLLPDNIKAGSIVKIQVTEDFKQEQLERERFAKIQDQILEKYGTLEPKAPQLRLVNVTQTSCVLEWDPLDVGSAQLSSLILYKQHARALNIPNPLNSTSTKVSGLSIDTEYEFQLKLSTTSGKLWSNTLKVRTHKMTDMSGITVCLGPLDKNGGITREQVVASLKAIGAKPPQKKVSLDTTHFVCGEDVEDDNRELMRAKNGNIPIVRPEWIRACELEKRIVGVRGFYLDVDRSTLESYRFTNSDTPGSTDGSQALPATTQETSAEGIATTAADSVPAQRVSDEHARNELSDGTVASVALEGTDAEVEVLQKPEQDIVETIEGPVSGEAKSTGDQVAKEPIDDPTDGVEGGSHQKDDSQNKTVLAADDKEDDSVKVNTEANAAKDDSVPGETQKLQSKKGEATSPDVVDGGSEPEVGPTQSNADSESPAAPAGDSAQDPAKHSPSGANDAPATEVVEPSLSTETAQHASTDPVLNNGEATGSINDDQPSVSNSGPDTVLSTVDEAAGQDDSPSIPGTPVTPSHKSSTVDVSPAKSTASTHKSKNKKKKGKRT